jgi:cytoskeletal protein CcmA (bactofilin family)
MFSKTKATSTESAPGQGPAQAPVSPRPAKSGGGVPSIVSPDLTITGDLLSSGDIQVDGTVKGDVSADTLTIGEQGQVHGTIRAERVRVCGTVEGEIEGGTVTLAASARVVGDVVHDSLAIEPGAHLEGHCRRRAAAQGARTAGRDAGAAKSGKGAEAAKDAEQPPAANGQASEGQKGRPLSNGSAAGAN